MILTVNNDRTRKWSSSDAELLDEADNYFLYSEAGWHCLILYKDQDRILHVHFNSLDERNNILFGCGYNVQGNYMYKMTGIMCRVITKKEKQKLQDETDENDYYPKYRRDTP